MNFKISVYTLTVSLRNFLNEFFTVNNFYKFENNNIERVIIMDNETIKNSSFKIPIEKHDTAAWANITETRPVSNVSIPNEYETRNAKEWVDSNQK